MQKIKSFITDRQHAPGIQHRSLLPVILAFVFIFAVAFFSRVVSFSSQIKDVSFNIETAIPLGLIINELISNALKHAFPEGKKGSIAVELTQDKKTEEYILTVTDDGIGFPEETDYRNTGTFGLQLVDMLTEQLHGTMKLDRTKGTSFRIVFRKQKYRKMI